MNKNKNKQIAFTLAEALITMTILGVIAALTIPGLTMSMQKSEHVSGMRKAYSTLTQAVSKMNFANDLANYTKFWDNDNTFWREFTKQLNTMKVCANNESGCFTKNQIKKLDGSSLGVIDGKNYTVRTADGYCYQYTPGVVDASTYGIEEKDAQKSLGTFLVDVNADGNPNTIGRDLYYFIYVEEKGVIPAGFYDHTNCNKGSSGYTCAGRLMKEIKMKY